MKRRIPAQILALLLFLATAQGQTSMRSNGALLEGRAAMQRHEYSKAIQLLHEALKSDPGNRELKNELAEAYLYSRDDDHAKALFEEVLATDPQDRTANLEMARLLGYHRQWEASDLRYRRMLANDPTDAQAAAGLVRNLIHEKKYGAARTELASALRRNPADKNLQQLNATLRRKRAVSEEREKRPARVGASESFFSDSGGNRVLRSDQAIEYSFSPAASTRLQLEEKQLWRTVNPSANVSWFSEEVKLRPTNFLSFMAGGGAVRFPNSSSRSLYRGAVELTPFRHVHVNGGFGRSVFAPTAQAALLNLTSEGWFSRVQGTPGQWRFNAGWSQQHLTDTNRATREDMEIMRWLGGTRFSVAAGYSYDHAHFSKLLSNGYFSPDRYYSNLGVTGIKLHPVRYWVAEYLVKAGEEQIETNPLRPAYEVSLRNRILMKNWDIDAIYTYYHIAQSAGAFTANSGRINVVRRF